MPNPPLTPISGWTEFMEDWMRSRICLALFCKWSWKVVLYLGNEGETAMLTNSKIALFSCACPRPRSTPGNGSAGCLKTGPQYDLIRIALRNVCLAEGVA
jgi:hypothetical protein